VFRIQRGGFGLLAAAFALVVLPGQALAGNATNVNITLPAAKLSLSGTVTKHGGGAIQGAMVQVLRLDSNYPEALAITDANGNYTIFNLDNGQYVVSVNPHAGAPTYMPGYYLKSGADHFTTTRSSATKLSYSGAKISNVNMAVGQGHSISGKIRRGSGGTGIKGVSVTAIDQTPDGTPFYGSPVKTDAAGNYVVPGLAKGNYRIAADPNPVTIVAAAPRINFLDGCYKNAPPHNFSANCASPTNVQVNTANVTGKNVDLPDGHQIKGAVKDAQGHNLCASVSASSGFLVIIPPSVTACGPFAIVGLGSGDYSVQVSDAKSSHFVAGLYANNAKHFVEVGTNGTTVHVGNSDVNLGTIKPPAGHRISGSIKSGNTGVANMIVTLHGSNGSYDSTKTDSAGKFTFLGVGSGTHAIEESPGTTGRNLRTGYYRANATGWTPDSGQATALSNADHSGLVMKPPAGYIISGKVANAAHQGLLSYINLQGNGYFYGLSNAQGVYSFAGLEPGNYTVSFSSSSRGGVQYQGGYYTATGSTHYTASSSNATAVHVGP
jgi:hypothetical protein